MPHKNNTAGDKTISLRVVKPYDFALSLRAIRSFQPAPSEQGDRLCLATRITGIPTLIEVRQSPGINSKLKAFSIPETDNNHLRTIVEWVLFAELDLAPFYRLIARDPKLMSVTRRLYGLKPMRPVSLFEMAVIAITEQQISLAAAYRIRSRIIQRFGEPIDNQWIFPEPPVLASAPLDDLRSCGLSQTESTVYP